jgi:hypothetical protein
MCKTKLWLVGALLGSMIAAAPSSETNAQGAPVPARVPSPPPAGQPQAKPAPASSAQVQATLSCGNNAVTIFSAGGAKCPSLSDNSDHWAMLTGLNGAIYTTPNSAFVDAYLACTYSTASGLSGFLTGVSPTPIVNGRCAASIPPNSPLTKIPEATSWCGGSFTSTKGDETCLVLFKHIQPANLSGWDPTATELILW